ncbi:MAG: Tyrosine-tRNA ligase [candidate division TM6 bacterium GW2011_GWF2_28_16]|jgi:tyrosyl-tRNA synthetase|nr:MAG: Tyrosine-tRNA ligase [candidate division TM6 bacterium GW2011_GWF2_28_16]
MSENIKKDLEILKSGTVQILPEDEFLKKLKSGKKLRIKLGADPTAPDLHLGHVVVLNKLRQFQDLGHEVIFLIGDFTALIGDPTGKSKTRPPLSPEEVLKNSKTYLEQVGKILDIKKTRIVYNSHWLSKFKFDDVLRLAGKVTVARVIEREDFAKRLQEKTSIGLHELFYPLMQGFDSVELNADVELGGTDQTFNLLMGRFLQEQYGQEPQAILTMPLLEGLDGVKKMSKSLGNYIGLWETGVQAYGKLMSISDELMYRYALLLLSKTEKEIIKLQQDVKTDVIHPMKLKKEIAHDIIAKYWSAKDAKDAQENFEALFQKKDYTQAQEVGLPKDFKKIIWIVDLLKELKAVNSTSDAKRLIESGAIFVDDVQIKDFKAEVSWAVGTIVKAGKHKIYKIK